MSTTKTRKPAVPKSPPPPAPPTADGVLRIDPDATYTRDQLADQFGVYKDTITRWCSGPAKKRQLPRPFRLGKTPFWRGQAIIDFMDRKQREADER